MSSLVIADDHPIVMEGLAALLTGAGHAVLARCTRGEEVLEVMPRVKPEVLLLDLHMPGMDGLEVLRHLNAEAESAPDGRGRARVVLLTSGLTEVQAAEAMRLGADGLVLKESAPHQLLDCLRQVVAGRQWVDREIGRRALASAAAAAAPSPAPAGVVPLRSGGGEAPAAGQEAVRLTKREQEIVGLVLQGLRNKQIADRLQITEGTVKIYLHAIYQKLGVTSRMELAIWCRERNALAAGASA